MSGMHLLPVYFTTTNHKTGQKKPRKKSKKMEAALKEHEKFLKKMGVSSNPVVTKPPKTGSTLKTVTPKEYTGNGLESMSKKKRTHAQW